MKNLIRIEEGMMLIFAIYLNTLLPAKGWIFWAFFLAPDIGFVGYAFGPAVGAWTYNLLHHKGVAIALYLFGGLVVNAIYAARGPCHVWPQLLRPPAWLWVKI